MDQTDSRAPMDPPRPATLPAAIHAQLVTLGRYRRLLWSVPAAAALVAAAVSLLLPKAYTAVARILPPQQSQSTAAALLGGLGGLAGVVGGGLGLKSPADLYLSMLRSDSVADALIQRFKLKEIYDEEYVIDTRKRLRHDSTLTTEKAGIITISVEAGDPVLAADLTNAYVEELHKLTSTLAVTEAAQRRAFFERQLQQTKDKLADAEVRLRLAIETGGLVSVDAQSRSAVETVARLRASISAKEIQLGAMAAYAAESNPERIRAERELTSMRRELAKLESGGGTGAPPEEGRDGAGRGKAGGIGNIRLLRDVKYQEVLFELLAKQYELARVDESKEAPLVQVMDRAAPPERRSRPKRVQIVLSTFAVALLTSILAALAHDAWTRMLRDPVRSARLEALRRAWLRRGAGK